MYFLILKQPEAHHEQNSFCNGVAKMEQTFTGSLIFTILM